MSRAIKSALHTARRISKKYADGGNIRDVVFDPTPMTRKTPNQRVREGHQEFEQGYVRGWEYDGSPMLNMRGQRVTLRRAAVGGAQRTAAFPEKPEGYEFYGPDDNPRPTSLPEYTPLSEGMPAYDPAQEPPRKGPPAAMEPDLSAMQTGQTDVPEGYAVNDAGEIFNRQTGEVLPRTPRMNVSPWTKTPHGDIEWNMPKMLDIIGNMGGGWSAPVHGGEAILGVGARLPRRSRAQPMTIERVLTELTPRQIQRLSRDQLSQLRADASDFLDRVSESNKHLDPKEVVEYVRDKYPNWNILDERLGQADVAPPRAVSPTPIPVISDAERAEQHRRNVQSIADNIIRTFGKDEAAVSRWFDTAEQGGITNELMNEIFDSLPAELRQRVKIHDAYANKPRSEPKPDFMAEEMERAYRAEFGEPPTKEEFNQIPYKPPTEIPPTRDYASLDELESALRGSPHRVPSDRPQVALQPQEPPFSGDLVGISRFFNTKPDPSIVAGMTDSQLTHLGEILHSRSDSFLRHLGRNRPELLRTLLREIATRGAEGRYSELIDKLMRQLLSRALRERIIPVGNQKPFTTPEEAKSWLRDNGHNPDDWGYTNPDDYVELANDISGRAPLTSTPHPLARQPSPESGANIRRGENIDVSDFFGTYDKRAIPKLSDQQLEHLAGQLNDHEAISSGFYSNLENYYPEMLSALRQRIRDRREATGNDPETYAIRQRVSEAVRRQAVRRQMADVARAPRPAVPDPGPFARVSNRIHDFIRNRLMPSVTGIDDLSKKMFSGANTKSIVVESYGENIHFSGNLQTEDGRVIGRIDRAIHHEQKYAYHGFFEVADEFKSTGIPAQILRDQIDLYKRIGLTHVKLTASLDSGPYAWLKYGWVPDKSSWEMMRREIRNEINRDYLHITDSELKDKILRILDSENPRSAWDIADIKGADKYGRELGPLMLLGDHRYSPKGINYRSSENPSHGYVSKKDWSGSLLLNDAAVMSRFDRYAKRKPRKETR